jgi:NAD(P)-dependent dehydrogenase (short-subunit alcohol dehydrogenase family)
MKNELSFVKSFSLALECCQPEVINGQLGLAGGKRQAWNYIVRYIRESNLDKKLRIFKGATAVVTGSASGIGRALAGELASRGCEVVLADLQVELAEEAASAIRAEGGKASAHEIDVADFSAVERLLQETVDRTGRLDFMFNNAGIGVGGPVEKHSIDDWSRIVDVNLLGEINGVLAAYKIMTKQCFGHIVNTASMGAFMPSPGVVAYAATKHGLMGLSTSLRAEAACKGIRVSLICPGVVRTPLLEGGKYGKYYMDMKKEEVRKRWEKLRPMPASTFARKALNAVARNKAIIIIPSWWRAFWWLNRLSPALGMFLARKLYEDSLKKFKG